MNGELVQVGGDGCRGGALEDCQCGGGDWLSPRAQCIHVITGRRRAPHQVLAYISRTTTSKPGVSLVYSMPSHNVSLRLQGLQEKDSGSYRCSVNVQDHRGINRSHSSKTLELSVLGKCEAHTLQYRPSPQGGQAGLSQKAACKGWRRADGVTEEGGGECRRWWRWGSVGSWGLNF